MRGNRPVTLKRHIRDELREMQQCPSRVFTEQGAWVLGIAKKNRWFPRIAAGVAADANKLEGMVR